MNTPSENRSGTYFSHINLLRAFAAISVLIYHLIELLPWKNFPVKPSVLLWFRTGWMGVDLFFVISGFVIMLSALKLQEKDTLISARTTFIRHRAARIVPLYLLTCIVFVLVIKPGLFYMPFPSLSKHVLTHLTFTHNLLPDTHGSINGPNWSVAVEFQFYLFVFLFMPLLKRMPPAWLLAGGIAVALATRTAVFLIAEHYQWGTPLRFIYTWQVISTMDEFCFGMLLARLVMQDGRKYLQPIEKFWKSKLFWMLLVITVAMFWITLKIYWARASYWSFPLMVIGWKTLIGLCFAMLIAVLILIPSHFFSRNPVYKAGHYLGEISYGIYLWHLTVLLVLKKTDLQDPLWFSAITLGGVFILSSGSWHFLEKPIMRRFK